MEWGIENLFHLITQRILFKMLAYQQHLEKDIDTLLAQRRGNGCQIVVRQGEVIGHVNLPIAGLMSNERAEVVARKAASVLYGFRACGCQLNNPNMQLSLLALVVIPELRISDLGLVDVTQFKFIPVLESEES